MSDKWNIYRDCETIYAIYEKVVEARDVSLTSLALDGLLHSKRLTSCFTFFGIFFFRAIISFARINKLITMADP